MNSIFYNIGNFMAEHYGTKHTRDFNTNWYLQISNRLKVSDL